MPYKNPRMSFWNHLCGCYRKGFEAFGEGKARTDNPYQGGYRGNGSNGPGGNLQRQRQRHWNDGYDRAAKGLPAQDLGQD